MQQQGCCCGNPDPASHLQAAQSTTKPKQHRFRYGSDRHVRLPHAAHTRPRHFCSYLGNAACRAGIFKEPVTWFFPAAAGAQHVGSSVRDHGHSIDHGLTRVGADIGVGMCDGGPKELEPATLSPSHLIHIIPSHSLR